MAKIGFGEHPSNIYERLLEGGAFPRFIQLVEATGIKEELILGGPYTLFVPFDEAIDLSPKGKVAEFEKALEDPALARRILHRHMIGGSHKLKELIEKGKVLNLNGEELIIKTQCEIKDEDNLELDIEGGKLEVFVNDAKIETANVPCSNGVLHVINRLL